MSIEERFVGESGFMLFYEIDHGGWLPRFGINPRTVRWVLGNPLIAITMIRHDITAGLFAPVEFLVTEKESGRARQSPTCAHRLLWSSRRTLRYAKPQKRSTRSSTP
jgi:uncharacterized protein (DUF302 family)